VLRSDGATHRLTTKEADLLAYLVARPDEMLSRDELLEQVWEYSSRSNSRTVDTTVRRLRVKVEADATQPEHVVAAHGKGYGFRPLAESRPRSAQRRWTLPMVGRQAEVAAIRKRLEPAGALVTVLGPGGVGKTRVASAVAETQPGPVHLVELDGVRTPRQVVRALAGAMALVVEEVDVLAAAVEEVGGVWVVDDCESCVDALREVLRALRLSAPETRWLLTSRRALSMPGEAVFHLGPLPLDTAEALFRQCAPAIGEDDALPDLLAGLEGLPLALELAAARSQLVPPRVMVARHGRWLDLLAANSEGRHDSMRASLDASWEILDEDARTSWALVAQLCGDASVALVEALLATGGADAMSRLLRLREASLVQLDGERWGQLALVRAYGRERADAEVVAAYARTIVDVAEATLPGLYGETPGVASRALTALVPDLLRVLGLADDPDLRARAWCALAWTHQRWRLPAEVDALYDTVHDAADPAQALEMRVSRAVCRLAQHGRSDALRVEAADAADVARQAGRLDLATRAMEVVANSRILHEGRHAANDDLDATIALAREAGLPFFEARARTLRAFGHVDLDEAVRHMEEAGRFARRHGAAWVAARTDYWLFVLHDAKQPELAQTHGARARRAFEDMGDHATLATIRGMQAQRLYALGELSLVRELAGAIVRDPRALVEPRSRGAAVLLLAQVQMDLGEHDDAVALLDRFARRSQVDGRAPFEAGALLWRGLVELDRNRLTAASGDARAAANLLASTPSPKLDPFLQFVLGLLAAYGGEARELPPVPAQFSRSLLLPGMASVLAAWKTGADAASRLETLLATPYASEVRGAADLAALATLVRGEAPQPAPRHSVIGRLAVREGA
jgi:hypothetical protein